MLSGLLRRSSQNPGSHRGVEDRKACPSTPAHSASLCATLSGNESTAPVPQQPPGCGSKRERRSIPEFPQLSRMPDVVERSKPSVTTRPNPRNRRCERSGRSPECRRQRLFSYTIKRRILFFHGKGHPTKAQRSGFCGEEESGEAPPAAEKASRFRGSGAIGGPEGAGNRNAATVCKGATKRYEGCPLPQGVPNIAQFDPTTNGGFEACGLRRTSPRPGTGRTTRPPRRGKLRYSQIANNLSTDAKALRYQGRLFHSLRVYSRLSAMM